MYDLNKNLEWFPAIIGGTPALVGEFPSLVSLQTRDGEHLCSGTLIEFDYILTAGHCVTDNVGNVLKINKVCKYYCYAKCNTRLQITVPFFENKTYCYIWKSCSNILYLSNKYKVFILDDEKMLFVPRLLPFSKKRP